MMPVIGEAEFIKVENLRRKGLASHPTIITAWQESELAGYLEYCRSWDNKRDIYIASLQILPPYRGGCLLVKLLRQARTLLMCESFDRLVTEVQATNQQALRLYQKLGFSMCTGHEQKKTRKIEATPAILQSALIDRLVAGYGRTCLGQERQSWFPVSFVRTIIRTRFNICDTCLAGIPVQSFM
ncbi:MAG: GNAT family N-acetyltransferase [Gammaproteobacteria bacterium]|nr:GNAT family N-acetyltransferase [Gammaproteobacteria bacterium]